MKKPADYRVEVARHGKKPETFYFWSLEEFLQFERALSDEKITSDLKGWTTTDLKFCRENGIPL